jgi:hypothetical protein
MRRVAIRVPAALLLLLANAAWADDVTGPVTDVSGRTAIINGVVLTFPPAQPNQADLMTGVQLGDKWTVTYTAGAANTVTKAAMVPAPVTGTTSP